MLFACCAGVARATRGEKARSQATAHDPCDGRWHTDRLWEIANMPRLTEGTGEAPMARGPQKKRAV